MTPKIATCCYCGTRAALVLTGDRHELACRACGAPLHDLKRFRAAEETPRMPRVRASGHPGKPPKRRRRSLKRRFFEEAIDILEDIFD